MANLRSCWFADLWGTHFKLIGSVETLSTYITSLQREVDKVRALVVRAPQSPLPQDRPCRASVKSWHARATESSPRFCLWCEKLRLDLVNSRVAPQKSSRRVALFTLLYGEKTVSRSLAATFPLLVALGAIFVKPPPAPTTLEA